MGWSLANLYLLLPGFALVLFRVAGLTLVAPMFSSLVIPGRIKAAFIFAIAAVVFPMVAPTVPADITLGRAVTGVVGEMLVGVIIGLAATIFIAGVQLTGALIGQQAGIALATVVDPTQGNSTPVVSQIYMIATMLIFLALGGHRMLIEALLDTFSVVPLLGFRTGQPILTLLADLLSAAFIMAVRLFAPVLIALMLATITMAFLSRTIPQLNILSVGFAVRAMVAIGVAALALGASREVLVDGLFETLDAMRATLGLDALSVS